MGFTPEMIEGQIEAEKKKGGLTRQEAIDKLKKIYKDGAEEAEQKVILAQDAYQQLSLKADKLEKENPKSDGLTNLKCDSPRLSDTGGSQIMVPTGGSKDEPVEV